MIYPKITVLFMDIIMPSDNNISFEISEKMGLILASCFEMVGLSTPSHISAEKMALVVDRIAKTRKQLQKQLHVTTDANCEKITRIKEDQPGSFKMKEKSSNTVIQRDIEDKPEKNYNLKPYESSFSIDKRFLYQPETYIRETAIVASELGVMRTQVKMILQNEDYQAFTVNNILELTVVLSQSQYDIVIVEVNNLESLISLTKVRSSMDKGCILMAIFSDLNNIELQFGVKDMCKDMGVNVFIEKFVNWQMVLKHNLSKYKLDTTQCG